MIRYFRQVLLLVSLMVVLFDISQAYAGQDFTSPAPESTPVLTPAPLITSTPTLTILYLYKMKLNLLKSAEEGFFYLLGRDNIEKEEFYKSLLSFHRSAHTYLYTVSMYFPQDKSRSNMYQQVIKHEKAVETAFISLLDSATRSGSVTQRPGSIQPTDVARVSQLYSNLAALALTIDDMIKSETASSVASNTINENPVIVLTRSGTSVVSAVAAAFSYLLSTDRIAKDTFFLEMKKFNESADILKEPLEAPAPSPNPAAANSNQINEKSVNLTNMITASLLISKGFEQLIENKTNGIEPTTADLIAVETQIDLYTESMTNIMNMLTKELK